MILLDRGSTVVVQAPAKLNLFLEVLSRRDDGFHELVTVMTAVNLYDSLSFRRAADGQVRLQCKWTAGREAVRTKPASRFGELWDELPTGADNLVVQAIDQLRRRTGTPQGVSVRVIKRIPAAAGLGGASADAAATLVGLNRLWKTGLTIEQLSELAAELGSDIPFFLKTGFAACRGRGERIEPQRLRGRLHFVVARPPGGLSTAAVYRQCQPATRPRDEQPLLAAARTGNATAVARQLHNRLEPAARQLSGSLRQLAECFTRLGCLSHQMSGSGTSYFGICRDARQARRLAGQLRVMGYQAVWPLHSVVSARSRHAICSMGGNAASFPLSAGPR